MQKYLYNLATDEYQGFIANTIKFFLFIFSLVYGLAVRIVILFAHFRPCRLKCKVISIGNITLGGTGKTSLVEYIARYLKEQGHKVAILSRGYKRLSFQPNTRDQTPSTKTMGDEPYMLFKNLKDTPVIVDADRIRGAGKAINDYAADTVILDDGFQQWRIQKDLEIVTIDATNPFGNRQMLPRGVLREPLSALRRADIFILTKTNLNPDISEIKDFLISINPRAEIFESEHQPMGFYRIDNPEEFLNPQELTAKTVTLFSGIADPDAFENLISGLGIKVGLSFRFRDHYNYTQDDSERITRSSREKNIDTLITTEKDAARIGQLPITNYQLPILVLRIALKIKDEERFHNRLLSLYSL